MRIAISGSHRVGKSTLLGLLAEALPSYATVDEPYHLLEEDGYECAEDPSIEDFEAQLERSLLEIDEAGPDVLFDRCPADLLAYLQTHADAEGADIERWTARVRASMQRLDLVVFVPIEESDRIPLAPHEDRQQRQAVDERLHELLVENGLGLDLEVMTVHGAPPARVDQIMARARVKPGPAPAPGAPRRHS